MKKFKLAIFAMFLSLEVTARAEGVSAPVMIPEPSIGLTTTELLVIATLLFSTLLLAVTITIFNAFKVLYKIQEDPTPQKNRLSVLPMEYEIWLAHKREKSGIWTKLLSLRPMEEEKELEIQHSYDGITELNNPVPTWFNVLFYGSIIFGIGYFYYYHIGEFGPRQDEEYQTEIVKAEVEKRIFLAKSASTVDESNVKIDESEILNGKSVFDVNCVACHGDNGQGLVGPNLTDDFWLHGGSISSVFITVKYGVPEKGMVSWEKNLSSKKISEVANYIMSLKGTNPPGAKAPQGEKYEETSVMDSVKNEVSKLK